LNFQNAFAIFPAFTLYAVAHLKEVVYCKQIFTKIYFSI